MIKKLLLLLLPYVYFPLLAQSSLQQQVKNILKTQAGVKSQLIDLDQDQDDDFLFQYHCSEPLCIEIYINKNDSLYLVYQQEESYELYQEQELLLLLKYYSAAESKFVSHRTFKFVKDSLVLTTNYLTYQFNRLPHYFLPEPYHVTILNDQYNVRFSAEIRENDYDIIDQNLDSCKKGSNIIGKLKQNTSVKVLAEVIQAQRRWLFVEIEQSSMDFEQCPSIFEEIFPNQKLRAWISSNFVKKQTN